MSDLVRNYYEKVKDLRARDIAERFPLDEDDKKRLEKLKKIHGKECTFAYVGSDNLFRCVICGGIIAWHGEATCMDCSRMAVYK